jgi:hypothetical protein
MSNKITDERLREIASSNPLVLAICAQMGEPSWADVRAIAAELIAARARVAELEQQPPMALVDLGVGVNWAGLREDMQRLRAERDAVRAQLHADDQRAWEALGKPEGTHDTTNVQRLCAEVERLRADMREAVELIAQVNENHMPHATWLDARDALLEKHKETNQ